MKLLSVKRVCCIVFCLLCPASILSSSTETVPSIDTKNTGQPLDKSSVCTNYVVIRAVIDAPCQQQGRLFLSGHSETGEVSETTVLFDENLILLTVLPESRYTVGVQTTAPYCHPSTFQLELVRAEGSCFSFFLFREEQQGVALRVNNKTIDALLTLTCDRSELLEAFATRPVESDVVRSDLGIWFYRAFVAFALSLLLFSLL